MKNSTRNKLTEFANRFWSLLVGSGVLCAMLGLIGLYTQHSTPKTYWTFEQMGWFSIIMALVSIIVSFTISLFAPIWFKKKSFLFLSIVSFIAIAFVSSLAWASLQPEPLSTHMIYFFACSFMPSIGIASWLSMSLYGMLDEKYIANGVEDTRHYSTVL